MAKKQYKKKPAAKKTAAGSNKTDKVLVRFTKSPASKFKIAAEAGKEKAFTTNQAKELVESGYAEYVN